MRTWTRAKGDTWCGSCSEVIHEGDPYLAIGTERRKFRRCQHCAGEPVNVEQIEAEDVKREANDTATTDDGRDFKRAAGGDE